MNEMMKANLARDRAKIACEYAVERVKEENDFAMGRYGAYHEDPLAVCVIATGEKAKKLLAMVFDIHKEVLR